MDNDIAEEMRALLYNFWIRHDDNQKLYYQIKGNQNRIKDFVTKNLGSKFVIHDRFIKLEKIPTVIKKNGGIETFTNVLDYVILMLLLLFLEDKPRGDKFLLSDLVDYIRNTSITLQLDHVPDWNKVSDRRSLVNCVKLLKELGVIKVKDEERIKFMDNQNAEALYESTGLSNYVMRIFDSDVHSLETPEEFIKSEFFSQEEEKGDVRRYRVFRNILYTPAVFSKDIPSSDIDYIKKNRLYIQSEILRKLDMETEITYNMAILYDDVNNIEKDNFPNTKKITEIVLMINARILDDISKERLSLDDKETITISESYLENIMEEVRKDKAPYVGKTFCALTREKFYNDVLEYMEKYNFVERVEDGIIIYPTVGRLIGKTCDVAVDSAEQISLFGGSREL